MNHYRILKQGETILPGDEFFDDRDNVWRVRASQTKAILHLATEGGFHLPHRRKVEYPEHTPPAPPEGMRWEYRGMGWRSEGMGSFYHVSRSGNAGLFHLCSGGENTHYFEAVPDVGVEKFYEKMDQVADTASQVLGYVRNDPKGAAGALKPQLQLIPTVAMQEEAKALDDGRSKYGQDNWRSNKVCISTYIGAILRHTLAYRDGEDVDPESKSGVHHLGSVRACCAILLDAMKHGTLVDDRPVKSSNQDTTI